MADGGAARTAAEVFSREHDYTMEKVFMPMLYPLVVAMSLFTRTGSIFWHPIPVVVGPVVERPRIVLCLTCLTFFALVLLHIYTATAWHYLGVPGSVWTRRQHAWFAPVGFWFVSTAFFFHYVNLPGMTGVHPAEKIVAQVSSSILLIFTIVFLRVAVPPKVSKLDEHRARV